MSFYRLYWDKLNRIKKGFPIIGIVWARQVGKTTFLKEQFPDYQYFNLETPETLSFIEQDPWSFLREHSHVIIDEIQRCPILFSYLLEIVDTRKIMSDFIISWSENLILSEKISQSLAWRVGYITMEAFSFEELSQNHTLSPDPIEQIFKWFMPVMYDREVSPIEYYESYIATYLERDVRQIKMVQNLTLFRKLLSLLAGRIGQVINYRSLSDDIGVDEKTVKSWISILEASYLVFQLQPYYENFGKRYIKSPKIYFSDTGLACRLLWIRSAEELTNHYIVGNLFENMMISEIKKQIIIHGQWEQLFFYRDSTQKEIDLIIEQGIQQVPIEIKKNGTYSNTYSQGIKYRTNLNIKHKDQKGYIIYTGNTISLGNITLSNRRDFNYTTL